MLWPGVLVTYFLVKVGNGALFSRPNNVCPTLRDYRTIYRNPNCSFNPDVASHPRLIAKRYGYPFEKHQAITDDGYILTLHRIKIVSDSKKSILIFHGLGGSSAFWMLQGKRSLAFFLADNGYDVWLGNWRGNYYSNKHLHLASDSREYWNFGFEEMAVYDLPACVDYVSNKTNERGNLIYVGHSMGTTISYIYGALKSEHAQRNLKGIVSLAPVAFMKNVMGAFRLLAPLTPLLSDMLKLKGIYALGQYQDLNRILLSHTCGKYPWIVPCQSILAFSAGFSAKEFQAELLPVFLSYYPSGISLKTLEHFAQTITDGEFRMFDYGPGNQRKYGKIAPPEYDLSRINLPIYFFVGTNDIVGNSNDVDILLARLRRGKSDFPLEKFTFPFAHNDFFLARHLGPFHAALLKVFGR